MLDKVLVALVLASLAFIGYLLVRAYYPKLFGGRRAAEPMTPPYAPTPEPFVSTPMPEPTKINTPPSPNPAPAPIQKDEIPDEDREISAGGPSAPNMRAPPDTPVSISPEAAPLDPYTDANMEAPIHDSMRHPELSFGPGVENTGINKLGLSGVGGSRVMASESPFSPEFAQNGASFMGTVFANDLTETDSSFANA
jgi:hypothetical protein